MGMKEGAGKEDIMGEGGILRNMGGNMGGLGLGETLAGIGREREGKGTKTGGGCSWGYWMSRSGIGFLFGKFIRQEKYYMKLYNELILPALTFILLA